MSSSGSSIEKAFSAEAADTVEAAPVMGVAMQPDLLDAMRDKRGHLPANVFQLARAMPAERRGPGRPKGAMNRRSVDLAKLVVHKYGDPVEAMASIYRMPLDQLVELLRLADNGGAVGKRGELAIKALNVQLAAAKAVSEYVHSKKPVEAVVRHQSDAVLVLPAAQTGAAFSAVDDATRMAGEQLAQLLAHGTLTAQDIAGLRLVEGQLVDAEYEDIDGDGEDDAGVAE